MNLDSSDPAPLYVLHVACFADARLGFTALCSAHGVRNTNDNYFEFLKEIFCESGGAANKAHASCQRITINHFTKRDVSLTSIPSCCIISKRYSADLAMAAEFAGSSLISL